MWLTQMRERDLTFHYHSSELELEVPQSVNVLEEEEIHCDSQMHHHQTACKDVDNIEDNVGVGEGRELERDQTEILKKQEH